MGVGRCGAAAGRRRLWPLRGGQRRRPRHFPPGSESVLRIRIRDTYLETGDPARLPAQHARRQDKGIEIVWGEEKIFWIGLTRAAKAGRKSLVRGTTSPANQARKDPFHLYSLSPHSPQFQQSAVTTPP